MQVSSRFTIAVHMFVCMEYFKDKVKITSDVMAASVTANPVIIRKIMGQLKAAGLVTVARGSGGMLPTREAKDITLLDIFRAVEPFENGRMFHFHENPNAACPVGRSIHDVLDHKLDEAQRALEVVLAQTSVADLISDTKKYVGEE